MLYKITNRSKVRLFYSRLNALKITPRNINQWLNINQLCATFTPFWGRKYCFTIYMNNFSATFIFFFSVFGGGGGEERDYKFSGRFFFFNYINTYYTYRVPYSGFFCADLKLGKNGSRFLVTECTNILYFTL